jgi:hypothetical protein
MSAKPRFTVGRFALALAVTIGSLIASLVIPSSSSAAAQDYSADAVSANIHAQCSLKLSFVDSAGRHYQLSSQGYPNAARPAGYLTIKKMQVHCIVLNGSAMQVHCIVLNGSATVVETTRIANSSVLSQNQQSFNALSGPTSLCADGKATYTNNTTESTGAVCVSLSG